MSKNASQIARRPAPSVRYPSQSSGGLSCFKMPILTEIRAPSAPPLRPQAVDAQNGNLALHISAQNGHMGLTSFLLESRRLAAIRELAYRPLGFLPHLGSSGLR